MLDVRWKEPLSSDALEQTVDAVDDKTYIMFDSEVQSVSDVFKAFALGAKYVFVGRLWMWGLSIMGQRCYEGSPQ
ncbi:hypothetical protein FKW77_003443 [Venturia effusa]|uniref:FMN-dependent dehydrogenase domain-containing protein n=1 Tax=Venturia effusa TaxID=50376 RepID=A0A517LLC4_9PEZI|nr:hypothetical protein FKW77_003443 [Venturia effusa]